MGFFRAVGSAGIRVLLKASGLFIKAVKSKEAQVLIDDLRAIDQQVEERLLSKTEIKKEFIHSLHKLKHTIHRLKQKGEQFEAQHIYHIYERFAQGLEDQHILEKVKKLHP